MTLESGRNRWHLRLPGKGATAARRGCNISRDRHRLRPLLLPLEDRQLLSDFAVTNTNDSGPGSFRDAILAANNDPAGPQDDIEPSGSVLNHVIYLDSPLPAVTRSNVAILSLSINGSAAGPGVGFAIKANYVDLFGLDVTAFHGSGLVISGSRCDIQGSQFTTNQGDGIDVTGGSNQIGGSTPQGPTTAALGGNVISGNAGFGIFLDGTVASGNLVENNDVGTTAQGGNSEGNGLWGIEVYDAPANVIGGIDQFTRGIYGNLGNVISGNRQGGLEIQGVDSTNETVEGNSIGTDVTGTVRIANAASGIYVGDWGAHGDAPSHVTIGGTAAGARNVISDNGNFGVWISGSGVTGVVVQGNFIGTDASGRVALGNAANGVQVDSGAVKNTIGGTVAGASNYISGNQASGITLNGSGTADNLIAGNIVGANVSGTSALPNSGWGVFLGDAGPGNTVGGASYSEAANVISGNDQGGVAIYGADAVGDVVDGHRIGTDITGSHALGNADSGVYVGNWGTSGDAASDTTIAGNVISANGTYGAWITGGARNTLVVGNIIGTDVTGTRPLGNLLDGVNIQGGCSGNTVGGTAPYAGNLISANGNSGVSISGSGTDANVVDGNKVGTDGGGSQSLGNASDGITIDSGAAGNTIGGTVAGSLNVISGNVHKAVLITDAGTDDNIVEGNYLGTDATGTHALGNGGAGVALANGAQDNTVGGTMAAARNVVGASTGNGVIIGGFGANNASTSDNLVEGNYIGIDKTGTQDLGEGIAGVNIESGGTDNTIGGTSAAARNVISGSGFGVYIGGMGASDNRVEGDYIGTDLTGNVAIGNVSGGVFLIGGASDNTIGGTTPAARNVISGNVGNGVAIIGPGTNDNMVAGNYIGTDSSGTHALGNGDATDGANGVPISGGASDNTIGGTAAGSGNVIAASIGNGVVIAGPGTNDNMVVGNYIGTDSSGTHALGNSLCGITLVNAASGNTIGGTTAAARNVISGNAGPGVAMDGSGTTDNVVKGDYIGTDGSGTHALGNGNCGVWISGGAQNNTIGGTTAAARDVISGNVAHGVYLMDAGTSGNLVTGDDIGTDESGTGSLGNSGDGVMLAGVTGNRITNSLICFNGAYGIEGILGSNATNNTITGDTFIVTIGTMTYGNKHGATYFH